MELEKLELLEQKIIKLVDTVAQLKNEKRETGVLLAQKEQEVREINDRVTELTRERELVRSKVDQLIMKVDNFEEADEAR